MHETAKSRKRPAVPRPPKGCGETLRLHPTHCQTSYIDKMIMHTLVQGLEDAVIAKDAREECTTNNNLKDRPTLEKILKLLEAKESAKMSMSELTRAQEEPHGTTNKVSNYHKGKSAELQPRSNKGTQGRSGTQPNSRPTCIFVKYQGHGCNKCKKPGHFRAARRSGPRINSRGNENPQLQEDLPWQGWSTTKPWVLQHQPPNTNSTTLQPGNQKYLQEARDREMASDQT